MKVFTKHSLLAAIAVLWLTTVASAQQQPDAGVLKHVSGEADALLLIRPAELLKAKQVKSLDHASKGGVTRLANLFGDSLFKMSLTEFEQIDELAVMVKQQQDIHDSSAFFVVMIKTREPSRQQFEIATNDAEEIESDGGKSVLKMARGGIGGFRFARIMDDHTIVWAYSLQGVKAVLQTSDNDHRQATWYQSWKGCADWPVTFGIGGRVFQNVPVSECFKNDRVIVGGLNVTTDCRLDIRTVGVDRNDSEEILAAINELLQKAKDSLVEIGESNDKGGWSQVAQYGHPLIQSAKTRLQGNQVQLTANLRLAPAKFGPIINSLVTQLESERELDKRRTLAKAILNFEQAYGYFPSSVMKHRGGEHSWRIVLLPMLGEVNMYEAYRFDQPWNSPHNQRVTKRMPDVFRSQFSDSDSRSSDWYLIHGKEAATDNERRKSMPDVADGPSDTIIAVEAKLDHHWAKPVDVELVNSAVRDLGGFHENGFLALFADGNFRFVNKELGRDTIWALLTANGGEDLESTKWNQADR